MIYRDISPRGSGKSTKMLQKALEAGICICTNGKVATQHFMRLARSIGVRDSEMRMDSDGVLHIRDIRIADVCYWAEHSATEKDLQLLCDDISVCMNRVLGQKLVGYSDDNGSDERMMENAKRNTEN